MGKEAHDAVIISDHCNDLRNYYNIKPTDNKKLEYITLEAKPYRDILSNPTLSTEKDRILMKNLFQMIVQNDSKNNPQIELPNLGDLLECNETKIYLCKRTENYNSSPSNSCQKDEKIFLGYRRNFITLDSIDSGYDPNYKMLVHYSFEKNNFFTQDFLNYIFQPKKQQKKYDDEISEKLDDNLDESVAIIPFYLDKKPQPAKTTSSYNTDLSTIYQSSSEQELTNIPQKDFFYINMLVSYDDDCFRFINKIKKTNRIKNNILRILTNKAQEFTQQIAFTHTLSKEAFFWSGGIYKKEAVLGMPALDFWNIFVQLDNLYYEELVGRLDLECHQGIVGLNQEIANFLSTTFEPNNERLSIYFNNKEDRKSLFAQLNIIKNTKLMLSEEKPTEKALEFKKKICRLCEALQGLPFRKRICTKPLGIKMHENLDTLHQKLLSEDSDFSAEPIKTLNKDFFEDMSYLVLLDEDCIIGNEILKRAWLLLLHAVHDTRYFTAEDGKNAIEFILDYYSPVCLTGSLLNIFQPLRGSKHPVAESFFILLTEQNVQQNIDAYFKELGQNTLEKTLKKLNSKGYSYNQEEVTTSMQKVNQVCTEKEAAFQKEFLALLKTDITESLRREMQPNVKLGTILPVYYDTLEKNIFPNLHYDNQWGPMLDKQFTAQ